MSRDVGGLDEPASRLQRFRRIQALPSLPSIPDFPTLNTQLSTFPTLSTQPSTLNFALLLSRQTADHGRLARKLTGEIMAMRRRKRGSRLIFFAAWRIE